MIFRRKSGIYLSTHLYTFYQRFLLKSFHFGEIRHSLFPLHPQLDFYGYILDTLFNGISKCKCEWTLLLKCFSGLSDHSKRFYTTVTFTHSHTHIHTAHVSTLMRTYTFIHRWHTSGAIWGSVSCPRTLWHVDWRSQGLNHDQDVRSFWSFLQNYK